MTEYGVQTNNIFDLLNAAEDPAKPAGAAAKPKARRKKSQRGKGGAASGQPQGQAQAAPQPKKDTQPGAAAKGPNPPRAASTQARGTTVTVSGGRGSGRAQGNAPSPATAGRGNQGGGRGSPQQGGPRQPPRQHLARGTEEFVKRHDDSHVSFTEEKQKRDTSRRPDEIPRQQGSARGREFDRHSGTGRNPTENKKGGGGGANWGKAEDEIAGNEDAHAELVADTPEAKKQEHKKKKKKKGKKGEEEKEEEKEDEIPDEQLKTLDDFKKEQATKAVKLTLPKARTAGEGVKLDPTWVGATKREDKEETFLKVQEAEPKKEEEVKKAPSKSSLRKKRKKEAKEHAAKKLAEQNISNMFDFSAKKEGEFPRGGRGRGSRGPREGGPRGDRGPREGGPRGDRQPREGSGRGPRGGGGAPRGNQQREPRKFSAGAAADQGAHFDDSAFPALQVGPPPITVD